MKYFKIAIFFITLSVICNLCTTAAEGDTPSPKRIALRRPVGKASKQTTPQPPPPAEEEEDEYHDANNESQYAEEGDEGGASASTSTTTTEAPKKVVGPVIRPFRSNDDFLTSLKRRQMNAKKHRGAEHTEKASPKSKPVANDPSQEQESEPAAPATPTKTFKASHPSANRRKPFKASKPEPPAEDAAAEESEQQQKEVDSKPKRPQLRLPLRKRS